MKTNVRKCIYCKNHGQSFESGIDGKILCTCNKQDGFFDFHQIQDDCGFFDLEAELNDIVKQYILDNILIENNTSEKNYRWNVKLNYWVKVNCGIINENERRQLYYTDALNFSPWEFSLFGKNYFEEIFLRR